MDRIVNALAGTPWREPEAGVFPALNVSQDDECFYVRAELPGIKIGDLEISALRNKLTLSGQRSIDRGGDRVSYHRREREEGSFSRSLTLPTDIDIERVSAGYADGVLTITLPKAAEAKPRQIAIGTR